MLILGHAGIALGAAVLLDRALSKNDLVVNRQHNSQKQPQSYSTLVRAQSFMSGNRAAHLTSLVKQIDIRVLLIGSLLPDIVDKPLGLYLFRDTFSSGRIFCHTLLFLILITIAGVYLYRRRAKVWLLVLSFGTMTHLILDRMWLTPRTLLWPFYGFRFPPEDVSKWGSNMLHELLKDPGIYVPELIGAVILAWFIWMLVRDGKVYAFIKNGRVL
jgi:membrane-bound metal-dependent hydrolase YbcI (DUF457 family)